MIKSAVGPTAFIVFGAALIVLALVYDFSFAGLPYQDPTPEHEASWRLHKSVADGAILFGAVILLAGCFWATFNWIRTRLR